MAKRETVTYESLAHFIATESRLQGVDPESFHQRFRQTMKDDDEQGKYDLYQASLDILQDEAQEEIDMYLTDLKDAQEEDPELFTPNMFGPKPPFPVSVIKFDKVYYHAGFAQTVQEIVAWVKCDDGDERLVIWTAECEVGDEPVTSLEWFDTDGRAVR